MNSSNVTPCVTIRGSNQRPRSASAPVHVDTRAHPSECGGERGTAATLPAMSPAAVPMHRRRGSCAPRRRRHRGPRRGCRRRRRGGAAGRSIGKPRREPVAAGGRHPRARSVPPSGTPRGAAAGRRPRRGSSRRAPIGSGNQHSSRPLPPGRSTHSPSCQPSERAPRAWWCWRAHAATAGAVHRDVDLVEVDQRAGEMASEQPREPGASAAPTTSVQPFDRNRSIEREQLVNVVQRIAHRHDRDRLVGETRGERGVLGRMGQYHDIAVAERTEVGDIGDPPIRAHTVDAVATEVPHDAASDDAVAHDEHSRHRGPDVSGGRRSLRQPPCCGGVPPWPRTRSAPAKAPASRNRGEGPAQHLHCPRPWPPSLPEHCERSKPSSRAPWAILSGCPSTSRWSGRDASAAHRSATPLELFFDLTFVVAVAQAASPPPRPRRRPRRSIVVSPARVLRHLVGMDELHLVRVGVRHRRRRYRVMVFIQMTGVLVLAAGIPRVRRPGLRRHDASATS